MSYYDWWKCTYSQGTKERKKENTNTKEQKAEQKSFFSNKELIDMKKWLKENGYRTKDE